MLKDMVIILVEAARDGDILFCTQEGYIREVCFDGFCINLKGRDSVWNFTLVEYPRMKALEVQGPILVLERVQNDFHTMERSLAILICRLMGQC